MPTIEQIKKQCTTGKRIEIVFLETLLLSVSDAKTEIESKGKDKGLEIVEQYNNKIKEVIQGVEAVGKFNLDSFKIMFLARNPVLSKKIGLISNRYLKQIRNKGVQMSGK